MIGSMTKQIWRLNLTGAILGWAALTACASAQVVPPAVLADASGYKYLTPYVNTAVDPALKGKELSDAKSKILKDRQAYNTGLMHVRKVLSGQVPFADNKSPFDFFYIKMYFPQFTDTSEEALSGLPIERQRLLRDHLEACTVPEVHKYLVENLVFPQMQAIVQDNYHPACRYSAMLVISSLNDAETVRIGASKATPEPMVQALPFIYEQFNKAGNTDAVRMAALLGLVRHLEWDNFRGPVEARTPAIGGPARDAIVKDLLALALQKEAPEGRDPQGHEWFRRRAIEGLMHAGYFNVNPTIAAAFETLLKDDTESVAIRCAAASALGKVEFQAPATLEIKPTAIELGYLALVACDKELTRVANLRKEEEDKQVRLSGGASGAYGGSYGGGADGGSDAASYGSGRTGSSARPGSSAMPGSGMRSSRGGSTSGAGMSTPRGAGSGRMMGPAGMGSAGMMPGGGVSGDDAYGGGYGEAPADPKQYRFDLIRRRIRAQLYAVEVALAGPDANIRTSSSLKTEGAAAPAGPMRGLEAQAKGKPEETFVNEVKTKVGKLVEAVEGADSDAAALEKNLRKQMRPLEAITRKLAAPAAAEAPSDVPAAPLGPASPKGSVSVRGSAAAKEAAPARGAAPADGAAGDAATPAPARAGRVAPAPAAVDAPSSAPASPKPGNSPPPASSSAAPPAG